jgi:hypothetical protein
MRFGARGEPDAAERRSAAIATLGDPSLRIFWNTC